jgi:hypothetical protein
MTHGPGVGALVGAFLHRRPSCSEPFLKGLRLEREQLTLRRDGIDRVLMDVERGERESLVRIA